MSFRNHYTSSYTRSRDKTRTTTSSATVDRPTTVTAKYLSATPSSSSIPILSSKRTDRSTTKHDSPITTIANRYANYGKSDKTTQKYEKTDYSKLTVPSVTGKSRDVSPISTSSKYSYTRSVRNLSPESRSVKSFREKSRDTSPGDREKNIPKKTDKSSDYNSLSNYKLYTRASNYTRPSSRTDIKPEIEKLRYTITNRLSPNYSKSSLPLKQTSVSPVSFIEPITVKTNIDKTIESVDNVESEESKSILDNACDVNANFTHDEIKTESETVTVITRHTSPTPPGSSAYVRSRRADMAKTIEKAVTRVKKRPEMIDKEVQSDRLDDSTRSSRYGSTARASVANWSYYTPNNYTGYAGRYSTHYSNLRENNTGITNGDRSSRSQSTEPQSRENNSESPQPDTNSKIFVNNNVSEPPQEIVTVYEQNKEDMSEIIINVNFKLKRAKSPLSSAAELISPELTITNSQLPPQPPKPDGAVAKSKKVKARKSSTDSSSDSSIKKKVVKKRSKSTSSTESEQTGEFSDKNKETSPISPSKYIRKTSSNSSIQNGVTKVKHSISRESNSPESSITLSTQSSISEDEPMTKSKTNDASRTSADDTSLSTDKSPKQLSQKTEPGAEEAKSFLIRALAPVTNLFKIRHQDSSESSKWPENSTSESTGKDISNLLTESERSSKSKNIIASNDDGVVKLKSIRHIESGERAWWMDSSSDQKCTNSVSDNNVRKIRHVESGEKAWWQESNIENKVECHSNLGNSTEAESAKLLQNRNFVDDEKPWWLDSSANIPEGIERLSPPRKTSSDSEKSEKYNFFKVRHIESGDQKDWWLTSNENSSHSNKCELQYSLSKSGSDQKSLPLRKIRHIESGERPWWLSSGNNIPEGIEKLPTPPPQQESDSSDSEEVQVYIPTSKIPPFPLSLPDEVALGDRRSPEGLETPKESEDYRGRTSPYENNYHIRRRTYRQNGKEMYISRYTDIDDILGTSGQIYSPFMDSILARRTGQITFDDDECEEIDPTQVRIHDSTAQRPVIKKLRGRNEVASYRDENQLDDVTLQVFKDGDYGPYLDLDSTLCEQDEELEGLQDNRKNALVLRTQLPVRVHSIIEKLLHSQGRELRRALFTLKQILQSDKDLVHDFVANKGLDCLMQIGNMENQDYIQYILRALGQILLYVDGMHGAMAHKRCIQWLYSLISSKFRHVVKTALKLLVIFVEYTEKNTLLLLDAINVVDSSNGKPPWYNVMKILQDIDASDTELLIYATTLINACLNNIPDRDTYYDQVDSLQDQGMDEIIQLYMTKQGTDLDLLRQLQIFEAVLLYEDGDDTGTALRQLDETVVSSVRRRSINLNTSEKRTSKKQQAREKAKLPVITHLEPKTKITNNNRSSFLPTIIDKSTKDKKELTTALRRRRDRLTRQAHHIIEQEELLTRSNEIHNATFGNTNGVYKLMNGNIANGHHTNGTITSTNQSHFNDNSCIKNTIVNGNLESDDIYNNRTENISNLPDVLQNGNQRYTTGLKQRIQNGSLGHTVSAIDAIAVIRQKQVETAPDVKDDRGILLNREHSIKDIAQRLTSPTSPTNEDKPVRVTEMTGIVSKAKEELAKSQSKEVIKSPSIEKTPKISNIKVSEDELHWEQLKQACLQREFHLCDLDFSDLRQDSDDDMLPPSINAANGPPPPPPGMFVCNPPPLPGSLINGQKNNVPAPPPKLAHCSDLSNYSDSSTIKKNKKTVKLFWREVQENPIPISMRSKIGGFIWDDLPEVTLDTKALEHLFESRTNDLIIKEMSVVYTELFFITPENLRDALCHKLMEPKRNLILDTKRSNAINIAMKKLPTPQTIKAAIMKMDATVIGREGIEKLLTMLPTEEEKIKIQEAQNANPDLPLGSAEQFLLTLASINELSSRLKLWVFKLDFDNSEKEIAEPLMDLKQGIEILKVNKTFKIILASLRSVGSFLNGSQVKGFRLEYLSKVMEVKDTVHKHPLLHHICEMIIQKFPDTTDFFSEVGPVIRASKVDFDILSTNLERLESDCKASWDHMKRIAKHDGSQILKKKINEFLSDAAERIILLTVIRKRVMNRYGKFLLYLGVPHTDIAKTKPSEFLKVIAEFALEYRTTRERVLQQLEKRANHRERNKTRGKMIIDIGNYNKIDDMSADSQLKKLLKTDPDTNSLSEHRRKQFANSRLSLHGDLSADDEIIESLVRSATSKRKPIVRERRKNRLSDKKSLNRTLEVHQPLPRPSIGSGSAANVQLS